MKTIKMSTEILKYLTGIITNKVLLLKTYYRKQTFNRYQGVQDTRRKMGNAWKY